MNIKNTSKGMAGIVVVLVMGVTAAIALLVVDSNSRNGLFWMSLGYLLYSELLLGLNVTDIFGSGQEKGMPFKAAQGVVLTIYFLFTLIIGLAARNFTSLNAYSIVQLVPALGVTVFVIVFAMAQYARRSSDASVAKGQAGKAEMNSLLDDLVYEVKTLPCQDELIQVIPELCRIRENMLYKATSVPGVEKIDQTVVQQISCISDQIEVLRQSPKEDRSKLVDKIGIDTRKLEHLLDQRESVIKQLR